MTATGAHTHTLNEIDNDRENSNKIPLSAHCNIRCKELTMHEAHLFEVGVVKYYI